MAEAVIHRAHVMDGLIDPAFAHDVARQETLVAKIEAFFSDARDFQDVIDRARIVGQEQKFLIAAGLLSGEMTASRAAEQFTVLAETLLRRLFSTVRIEFEKRHGRVPNAPMALLGFGKMASREMTFTSDLDFVMLYDAPVTEMSDGEKPLAAIQYFARLTQRLIAAVSAPTAEGVLYEADMRLRPSGNAGPLATSLAGFIDYHRNNAWTWEHLALSRARVILADAGIADAVETSISAQMHAAREPGKTIADAREMRELMLRERKQRHAFDLKLAKGGLIDLEFIAQSAQLVAGDIIAAPQASTEMVLQRLFETGLLPVADRMVEIHRVYSAVLQIMSAALLHPFSDDEWSAPFKELLARLTHYPSFERLADDIEAMRAEVGVATAAWYARAEKLNG
jgi:glutamate-ammonia-ligase adenylyltransferase